jgi:hypothetical protein
LAFTRLIGQTCTPLSAAALAARPDLGDQAVTAKVESDEPQS